MRRKVYFSRIWWLALLGISCTNPFFQLKEKDPEAWLESLEIVKPPNKTRYEWGEALETDGLELRGNYSDGAEKTESLQAAQVTGYNPYFEGPQEIKVTLADKSAVFTVTVGLFLTLDVLRYGVGEPITMRAAESLGPLRWTAVLYQSSGAVVSPGPVLSYPEKNTCRFSAPALPGTYRLRVTVTAGQVSYTRNYTLELAL
jgi:hypothetical protein